MIIEILRRLGRNHIRYELRLMLIHAKAHITGVLQDLNRLRSRCSHGRNFAAISRYEFPSFQGR